MKNSKPDKYISKILMTEFITHDVKRFILQKPKNYTFSPGQATYLTINKNGWRKKKRPFTFTSSNNDLILEFLIKKYPKHEGVTAELHQLRSGTELYLYKPFDSYKFQKSGVFIAGGTGITPFIAIFRHLKLINKLKGNTLIFSNKKRKDIILEKELKNIFSSSNLILTLTREESSCYKKQRVNSTLLQQNITDLNQNFYICGPPKFTQGVKSNLISLGVNANLIQD